jgi:penicillin-binding protein-related factor A (putative recombinase)
MTTMTIKKPKIKIKETDVQAQILDYLLARKMFVFRTNNAPVYDAKIGCYRKKGKYQRAGMSDILGSFAGRLLAIEVKKPGGKPSDEQVEFIDDVNRYGGIGFIIDNLDDVIKKLNEYLVK